MVLRVRLICFHSGVFLMHTPAYGSSSKTCFFLYSYGCMALRVRLICLLTPMHFIYRPGSPGQVHRGERAGGAVLVREGGLRGPVRALLRRVRGCGSPPRQRQHRGERTVGREKTRKLRGRRGDTYCVCGFLIYCTVFIAGIAASFLSMLPLPKIAVSFENRKHRPRAALLR